MSPNGELVTWRISAPSAGKFEADCLNDVLCANANEIKTNAQVDALP
jgi:hypothetical protein